MGEYCHNEFLKRKTSSLRENHKYSRFTSKQTEGQENIEIDQLEKCKMNTFNLKQIILSAMTVQIGI